ncbi:MAG: SUMF1/EgtB/PvdO family nonheme iron enzyme [Anaerolineales bacterium]|nr:SUMF1/EgtB/PvdO family nonheme iron enzyme [Anaerolineales bacterium]
MINHELEATVRLFISYARVDYFQVSQIVEILRRSGHEPWFDHALLPGQDWQAELLRAIEACEAFVYALSPESLASQWCQWEFQQAVLLGRPIVPVKLQTNIHPPEAISRFQIADFSDGPTPAAVAGLVGGIYQAKVVPASAAPHAPANPNGAPAQVASGTPAPTSHANPQDLVQQFYQARGANQWAVALSLLRQIQGGKKVPRGFRLDVYVQEAEQMVVIEQDYKGILAQADYEDPAYMWDILTDFWAEYATSYDPAGLNVRFNPTLPLLRIISDPTIPPPERAEAGRRLSELGDPRHGVGVKDGLPEIDWVEIPDDGEWIYQDSKHSPLSTYYISRYPITYAQFQTFIDDPAGFTNPDWWQGLAIPDGHHQQSGEQAFKYWNHPRERMSWFDAIAFCRWWSAKLIAKGRYPTPDWTNPLTWPVRLPTEQEWEKAARGTDGRVYPWGDEYISGYANIDEKNTGVGPYYLEQTTAVGLYPQGQSPYGVMDMYGNVWEWCLNEYGEPDKLDILNTNSRVLRGGSWSHYGNLNACAAVRNLASPSSRLSYGGCRVVCVRPPSP